MWTGKQDDNLLTVRPLKKSRNEGVENQQWNAVGTQNKHSIYSYFSAVDVDSAWHCKWETPFVWATEFCEITTPMKQVIVCVTCLKRCYTLASHAWSTLPIVKKHLGNGNKIG